MRPERRGGSGPLQFANVSRQVPLQNELPPTSEVTLSLPQWFYTLCAGLILLFCTVQTLRQLRSGDRAFEMNLTLALRSGAIFLLLMVPLTSPELQMVPSNIQAVYIWLPLWYMSMLQKSLGGWIQISCHASAGTAGALLVILVLNKAIPRDVERTFEWKWMAIVFVLAYVVGLSKANVDLKKFFFGTLSPLLVMCMARVDVSMSFFEDKETALIYEEHVNYSSIIFCYVYLLMTALALSAFTLLLRLPVASCLSGSILATTTVTEDLAELALDTWRSEKLLLQYFLHRPNDFDLDTLGQHLQLLKTATLHLENRMIEARWETFCWQQHRRLSSLLNLLTSLHMVLLAALAWLRGHLKEAQEVELAPFLQEFESASGTVLRSLFAPWWLQQNEEDKEASVVDALEHTELSDGALMACLEHLRDPGRRPESTTPESSVMQPAAAFVDMLREIPKSIKDFLLNKVDVECQTSEASWFLEQAWLKNDQRQAVVYALAWLASLFWCIRFRGGSALCAILVSWLLPFRWVTLRGTLNEFLGTAGGVILGALPSFVLQLSPSSRSAVRPGLHELFPCFTLMYILWTVATYYAQVQAFQWRVAALFWSCFGGVEMLRDFGLAEHLRSNVWKQKSWESLVDFSLGCGLVFFTEFLLGSICREVSAKSKAADATAQSLETCAKLVGSMQDSDGYLMRGQASELLTRVSQQQQQMQELRQSLVKQVMEARFWNSETLQCASHSDIPRRSAVVCRILDQCDAILLVTRVISWSSERFGGPGPSALMLKGLIPPYLASRLHHCSEVCLVALEEPGKVFEAPKGGLHGTAAAMQHAGDAANVAAAAAATAMRGAVNVMLDALNAIEGALFAQEVLAFSSWSKPAKQVSEPRESFGSDMA